MARTDYKSHLKQGQSYFSSFYGKKKSFKWKKKNWKGKKITIIIIKLTHLSWAHLHIQAISHMNAKPLRCMSIPLGFSTMFMKGNNFCEFLFLPCMRKPFNTGINSKRKEFALACKSWPTEKGVKNENGRTAFPKSVSIHSKWTLIQIDLHITAVKNWTQLMPLNENDQQWIVLSKSLQLFFDAAAQLSQLRLKVSDSL